MQSKLQSLGAPPAAVHAFLNNTRKQHRWLDFSIKLTKGFLTIFLVLLAYLFAWGVLYRLPHSQALIVDTRIDKLEQPHYVAICAALAANKHGFPGHAYVAWSDSLPIDLAKTESLGFVPQHATDQIPSLWRQVPGAVVESAADNNQRNLNAVIAIVDRKTFERSRERGRMWRSDKFKVGSRDCVAFTDSLAATIGLKTPDTSFKYPQDYVEQLKNLNKDAATTNQWPTFQNKSESRPSLKEQASECFAAFRMKFACALRSEYDSIVSPQ